MLLVVGGHSRNIGKTSVVSGLIRKLRSRNWTAVKITQYGHGICSHVGEACGCETELDHPFAVSEEYEPSTTDSGRFLASGAVRSFWLRTPMGGLAEAKVTLQKILDQSENVIIESNSVLDLVTPDLFLMVLDFSCQDFKPSSLRFMDRADAFLVVDSGFNAPLWEDVARGLWDQKPQFLVKPPAYVTTAVCDFVRSRISPAPAR
ncbi:MAG TPA: hypothetical protein VLY24_14645 [Bryobacteraceae bacterium]|nr:hypothetical protein [Bryobacteraceae bacterium]